MSFLTSNLHLNRLLVAFPLLFLLLFSLTACDSDPTPTPGAAPDPILQPTLTPLASTAAVPTATAMAIDTPAPTATLEPTATPIPTGPMTALTAFSLLKFRAIAWQADAQFLMLANVRQGQAVLILGVALGDSSLSAATPGGKGENWTLLAVSPSAHGVMAFSMDGSEVDLVAEGRVPASLLTSLTSKPLPLLAITNLNIANLRDSDVATTGAGDAGKAADASIALISPGSLGLVLGTSAPPLSIGLTPALVYELFTSDPTHSSYAFFDAYTGDTLQLHNP